MGRGAVYVGTSGYQYDDWKGAFYPETLPGRRWFEHYAARFPAVELNGTFYSLPKADTVARWRAATPRGFRYAVKFSRYGSHTKRLRDPSASLSAFFDTLAALKPVCGAVLLQLPPRWRPNAERLDAFLDAAPRRWRWAVEVRDQRWLCESVFEVLRSHDAALVHHDLFGDPGDWPETASWSYYRLHGGEGHDQGYSDTALRGLGQRITGRARAGNDCFTFFNNDVGAHAPADADRLRRYLAAAGGCP